MGGGGGKRSNGGEGGGGGVVSAGVQYSMAKRPKTAPPVKPAEAQNVGESMEEEGGGEVTGGDEVAGKIDPTTASG
eukprot:CAMPEP_0118663682 /NCGR_PEP_ID=MMETSP0785-20121206/17568_1 /TAXON_ID=91992 /ORGANISM="Bolidomonas pacifica, Strain CCMP 1866" /LENGTH=75 /DNA_ID=CAMNT_0006557455 /DNA_START=116 /DNA_END=343 /DNA_ORIENTATION=+